MKFDILTIFPGIINSYASESILKRGHESGKIKVVAHDFRQFATDKHHKVDDSPYGGGPGMVLKVEPIYKCLKSIKTLRGKGKTKIIILDPAGKKFDQKMAQKFSKLDRLILICGRYEGFDERIYTFADEKVSVGDYILSGGELPALVILEAVARLIPGVLGNSESLKEETFGAVIPAIRHLAEGIQKSSRLDSPDGHRGNDNFKEYPQYTRPENFMGLKVPKILLTGHHKKIEEWRRKRVATQ